VLLAAAGILHAQGPALPPIPKGTNVLFGRVLEMGTGQPVGGAVVTLVGYFETSGRPAERLPQSSMSPLASAPRSVLTTSDGYFFFRELPAGRYSISADAIGYVSDTYPLRIVELANRTTPTEVSLRIWKPGAISGTVIDEQGESVVGVPVTAFQSVTSGAGLTLRDGVATVRTDDRGVYRLAQLPPGRYVVAVLSSSLSLPATLAAAIDETASNRAESSALTRALLRGGGGGSASLLNGEGQHFGDFVLKRPGPPPLLSPDGSLLTYATTFHPGAVSLAETTAITIGSGEGRTGIDVALRFAPTVEVSGVVTGPNGPMNGLTVELMPPTGATTWVSALEPRGGLLVSTIEPVGSPRAITDANGAFRFLAVPPGSYLLQAGFIEPARPDSGDAGVSLQAVQPLSVGERGVRGLTVALTTGARVSGRVEFKGAAESPLAAGQRLSILLRPVGADFWRSLFNQVAPDGTFTTGGDPPGRYIVSTSDPPGWTLESVSRGGHVVPDDMIELNTADVTGLVLTFSKTPTRLSGSIADANGAPDANAGIVVFPADTGLWREGVLHNRRARMMRATSAGTFEFSGLAPGEYHIAAVSAGSMTEWQDPSFLERILPAATTVMLGAGEEKTVPLKTVTPRER
jgi:protocatechuate 3,4-dioxygenase beta subunit